MLSIGLALALTIGTSYPSGDCANLSVAPEAMNLLNLPAETSLAQCAKGDVTLDIGINCMSLLAVCVKNDMNYSRFQIFRHDIVKNYKMN